MGISQAVQPTNEIVVPQHFGGPKESRAETAYGSAFDEVTSLLTADHRQLLDALEGAISDRVTEAYDLGVARGLGQVEGANCGELSDRQAVAVARSTLLAIADLLGDLA